MIRRDFLGGMTAGLGAGLLASCGGAVSRPAPVGLAERPVRRSVHGMAPDDPVLVAYRTAVARMKALPASDRRSWRAQAQIHLDYCPHGNWLFLPWHRAYLHFFERICRRLSGYETFALPYWNWSRDRSVPAAFLGGADNPLFDPARAVNPGSEAAEANIGEAAIEGILDETNFLVFASEAIPLEGSQRASAGYGRLEATPHNYIHGFIGGDMGGFLSPLDPLFWAHHNMVERLWVAWNYRKLRPNPRDRAWLDRTFGEFCDEDGRPVTVRVTDLLLYPAVMYRFDDVEVGRPRGGPAPTERDVAGATAAVRVDVMRRFTADRPIAATIDRPASVRIGVVPRGLDAPRAAERGATHRRLLAFEGASLDHTTDFSVRVFIGKPDATAETPISDPHFAGAFGFFHHEGHGGATGRFVVDVGPTLDRLGIADGDLAVTTVLVPFAGRAPRTRELAIASVELRAVRDVVAP